MHSPAAKASVERVASGDHSLDAIAQLLICLSECFESQSRKMDDIRAKIGAVERLYQDCPARQQPSKSEAQHSIKSWLPILKIVLGIVYALVLILAAVLGVKVVL
jgi:hypothetical protein